MTARPVTLPRVARVREVVRALTEFDFHGFPIVDEGQQIAGLITRQNLSVLMKRECWTAQEDKGEEERRAVTSNQQEEDAESAGGKKVAVLGKRKDGRYRELAEEARSSSEASITQESSEEPPSPEDRESSQ